MTDKNLAISIKNKALELGFDLCGIAPAGSLSDHEPVIKHWCASGMNGDMSWIGRNIQKRVTPSLLFPETKSVIVTGLNYYTGQRQGGGEIPIISRYAYGKKYQDVIIGKLKLILDYIKELAPEAAGKAYCDSSGVLEKAWARKAGLGWPGRHSILINKQIGSFFFLGIILTSAEMDYDEPADDYCGKCRICIESCPTKAINDNRTIDVRKCISYLTLERKLPVEKEFVSRFEGRVYGCDKCQEVCPWNRNARQHKTKEFEISPELEYMTAEKWQNLTPEDFKRIFKNSPVGRRKYETFMRNIANIMNW